MDEKDRTKEGNTSRYLVIFFQVFDLLNDKRSMMRKVFK